MPNVIHQFTETLLKAGFQLHGEIMADGKIHRLANVGDKRGKRSGWYVLHLDGIPSGSFGNWKTREQHNWCAKSGNELTFTEIEENRKRMYRIKEQRLQEEIQQQKKAQKKSIEIWQKASIADINHPYLSKKQIDTLGIKQSVNTLIVPLIDIDETLHSLQFIKSDGTKRFLKGGKKSGCFGLLGDLTETLCITEGWATGASIHQATGYRVIVAYDCGNLLSVAEKIRKKHPAAKLIICADDDYQTDQNPGLSTAKITAQQVSGHYAIPTFGENRPMNATDFNDMHLHLGLDAVRKNIERAAQSPIEQHRSTNENRLLDKQSSKTLPNNQWPPLLLPGSIKLPTISANILPDWAGDMVRHLAAQLQVDETAVILTTLSMISVVSQRRYEVAPYEADDYTEPLSLWVLTILESGGKKTPILNALIDPLKKWEKSIGDRMHKEITNNEAMRRVGKKRIEKLETKAGNTEDQKERDNLREQIRIELESMPRELKAPRLMTSDVTPEKLQDLLVEQRERMALISDEGGIFSILSGQYSGGNAMLDVFLQGYSGASVRVDRRSREASLEKPALSFCLLLQPGILQSSANDRRFHDSGLLARFLFAIPENTVGKCDVRKRIPIPVVIKQKWHDELHNLLEDAEKPTPSPQILQFDPEAREIWLDFNQKIEDNMGDGCKLSEMKEWAAKLPGTCARIAGLIQLIIGGRQSKYVETDAANRSVALCEHLIEHAKAAFQILGADGVEADALQLMKWIHAKKLTEFERSHAQKALESRFRTVDKLKAAAQRLYEWNVLSSELQRPNKNARSTPYYLVNPQLFDFSTNSL